MTKREQPQPNPRGPGRPATGAKVKKVSITIPTELWKKAEHFAFTSGLPLSGVISEALAKHLGVELSRAEKSEGGAE
jgi:hypothetical protein